MAELKLKIEHLVLDHNNPRITHAEGQQQALQKIIKDQKTKLVRLAQSIVEHGLSPIDRLMVLEVNRNPKRYILLEGNHRIAALRILTNPAVMTNLTMPSGMQKLFERLAAVFDKSKIEPIACYEVPSREAGNYWLELRHNGENQGRGIVDWSALAQGRFRKSEPAIQALDFVTEHAGLTGDETEKIEAGFPVTTLKRLLEAPDVRKLIGVNVRSGKLATYLPADEVLKPLKQIVLDLAAKRIQVGSLMKKEQMVDYVNRLEEKQT